MSFVVGGSSTYSKAMFCDVEGYPKTASYGLGSQIVDEEGNYYLDWTASLGAVILGYRPISTPPYLTPSLPIPTRLEGQVAEKFCSLTSWNQVRFCKNGSDATEAAVRLARYVTSRELAITTGYHGSHDSLVTATPSKQGGVPNNTFWGLYRAKDEADATDAIRAGSSAALITEPYVMGSGVWDWEKVKKACDDTGTLLIFDEVITGFRTRAGSMVDVRPHLACYGKAIANGMPLALIAGPRHLMKHFEQDVFMSATAAGEQLSLKACLDTLNELTPEVYERLERHGNLIGRFLNGIVRGYPQRWQITLDTDTHRKFVGALAKRHILVGRDFFQMANHTDEDVERTVKAIEEVRRELGI